MDKEVRFINGKIQSSDDNSRTVEGYALVFNKESADLGGFTEVIDRNALNEETLQKCDIKCWLNHDEKRGILARYKRGKGSLQLTIDEIGLHYRFEAPKNALGDELIENLKRGDIDSSSFAFTLAAEGGQKLEKRGGKFLRTILKFEQIYDVSPVYDPAYSDTTVATRSINEVQKIEAEKLEEYWNNLKKQIIE